MAFEGAASITSANVLCDCCSYLNMSLVNSMPKSYGDLLDLVFTSLSVTCVCSATESLLNEREFHAAYEILPLILGLIFCTMTSKIVILWL